MRHIFYIFLISTILVLTQVVDSNAQFRDDLPSSLDWSGEVVKAELNHKRLFGLVDFQMGHSYEMTMGSFAGNTYNQNMYTNTMHLFFNDRLTGRLDMSVAHSPFGNSFMGSDKGPQFFIRNAELNYALSENSNISISYRQLPYSSMYNPYQYNPYYSPFRSNRRSSAW